MAITDFRGDYRWLSNFQAADVSYNGLVGKTTEHAYQAAKTMDPIEQRWVLDASTPGKARRRGQKVTMRKDWETLKLQVMRELTYQKYSGNKKLKELLLATGNQHLMEGNHWGDKFWGVCEGEGLNHLGRILMDVRYLLRNTDVYEEDVKK